METRTARWTLAELAKLLGGELCGPADLQIDRPVSADDADPQGIAFAESEEYILRATRAGVGALLIGTGAGEVQVPCIRVEHPREAFGMLLALSTKPLPLNPGIHATAVVDEKAQVAQTAQVGAYAVIESGAVIGDGVRIFPFCYVGENCEVHSGSVLYPHVVLYQDVVVGERCILHSGCVLGGDGFGFLWDGNRRIKVPQVGRVVLGDGVEIGSNTTIDRATAGSTVVGEGTKLDNLVQIGHNCQIGKHGVIAGQTGISGSTRVGDRVMMGGGVGTKDHVTITDDVSLGGRSSVDRDIREPGEYFGTPARPAAEAVRAFLLLPKLPELFARIRAIEKRTEGREPSE